MQTYATGSDVICGLASSVFMCVYQEMDQNQGVTEYMMHT